MSDRPAIFAERPRIEFDLSSHELGHLQPVGSDRAEPRAVSRAERREFGEQAEGGIRKPVHLRDMGVQAISHVVSSLPRAGAELLVATERYDEGTAHGRLGKRVRESVGLDEAFTGVRRSVIESFRSFAGSVDDFAQEQFPGDPELQESFWWTDVPQAIGSFGTFIAATLASGPLAPVTAATLAGAGGISEAKQRTKPYVDAGELTEEEANNAALMGVVPGLIQIFPVMRAIGRFHAPAERGMREGLKKWLGDGVKGAFEESIVESLGALGQNAIERLYYNPDREFADGVMRAGGAGGAAGFVANFALSAARLRGVGRLRTPRDAESLSSDDVATVLEDGLTQDAVTAEAEPTPAAAKEVQREVRQETAAKEQPKAVEAAEEVTTPEASETVVVGHETAVRETQTDSSRTGESQSQVARRREPWQDSDLATSPNIPIGRVQARKQADGSWILTYRGTENEVFQGERFRSASEARQFFKAQQVKAQSAATESAELPTRLSDLRSMAESMGLDSSGTRAEVRGRIAADEKQSAATTPEPASVEPSQTETAESSPQRTAETAEGKGPEAQQQARTQLESLSYPELARAARRELGKEAISNLPNRKKQTLIDALVAEHESVIAEAQQLRERVQQSQTDQTSRTAREQAARNIPEGESPTGDQISNFSSGIPIDTIVQKVLQRSGRTIVGTGEAVKGFHNFSSQSLIGVVRGQGEGGKALARRAESALTTNKRIRGRFEAARKRAVKLVGRGRGSQVATNQAQKIEWLDLGDGVRAGVADIQGYLDGSLSLDGVHPRLRAWVQFQQRIQARQGVMAENAGWVQEVPPALRKERRAEVRKMSDEQAMGAYRTMFGRDAENVAVAREALGRYRAFRRVEDGKTFLRFGTEHMADIYAVGEQSPLWEPYTKAVAAMNDGLSVSEVQQMLKPYTGLAYRETNMEIPRVIPNHPTHLEMHGRFGPVLIPLLNTHPVSYTNAAIRGFSNRFAVVKEFGQQIRVPGIDSPLMDARKDAVEGGADPHSVDALLNVLSGVPLDHPIFRPGTSAYEAGVHLAAIRGTIQSSLLTHAWIPNLPEFLGNIRAFGGTLRTMKALRDLLPGRYHETVIALERYGLSMADIADLTIDNDRWLRSAAKVYGEGILRIFPTRPVWSWQEKHAAAVAYRLGEDLRAGRGTIFDRITLRSLLGYSKEDAKRLTAGEGTKAEYIEVMQRFAARSNTTRMTHPIEESRAINTRMWRAWMWFTRYPLMKTRTLGDISRTWLETANELRQERTADNTKLFLAATAKWSNVMAGTTASGAMNFAIRAAIIGGVTGGLAGLWREIEEDPAAFFRKSFIYAGLGPIFQSLNWTVERGDPAELRRGVAGLSILEDTFAAVWSMWASARQTGPGFWPYNDRSPSEIAAEWFQRKMAISGTIETFASRADDLAEELAPNLATVISVTGLGSKDVNLDRARRELRSWQRRNNMQTGFGSPGDMTKDDVLFRRHMRRAMDVMYQKNRADDDAMKEFEDHIIAALALEEKDARGVSRSLRGRKIMRGMNNEQIEQFREFSPESARIIEEFDSVIEHWADNVSRIERRRRRQQR